MDVRDLDDSGRAMVNEFESLSEHVDEKQQQQQQYNREHVYVCVYVCCRVRLDIHYSSLTSIQNNQSELLYGRVFKQF